MLALKYNVNPYRRQLLVHEEVAIEGAKNIVKAAAGLPKPLTPTGHVPVLVDVRCMDSKAVYHFHVNVPTHGWPPEDYEELGRDTECQPLRLMFPRERPPCPIHSTGLDGTGTMGVWHDPNSADKTLLLVAQTGVHKVLPHRSLTAPVLVSTITEAPTANPADEKIKAHFMAALHQQQSSPLAHSVLWVNECKETVGAHQPPPLQIEELQQDETNACVAKTPESGKALLNGYVALGIRKVDGLISRPLNGYQPVKKLHSPSHAQDKVPELCLDSSGAYVQNEQIQRQQSKKPFNGIHKQPHQSDSHPSVYHKLHGPNGLQSLQTRSALVPKSCFKVVTTNHHYSSKKILPPQKKKFSHKNGFKFFAQMRKQKLSPPRSRGERPMMVHLEQEVEIEKLWDQKPPSTVAVLNDSDEPARDQARYPNCPPELHNLFRWNNCRLCHTTMRTMRNAMEHYRSKEHDRRMGSLRMPDGLTQSSVSDDGLQELPNARSIDLYCELCDLKLTSNVHADQHFHGRRHQMVAHNLSKPNGLGYYNSHGRWVRTDSKWLNCELCDVSITSESQMAMHMAGARHRRRVLDSYISGDMAVPFDGRHMYRVSTGSMTALKPLGLYTSKSSSPKDPDNICAMNAAYYCEACDITLNHLKSVKQHEQGRLHKKNINRLPPVH
ncbi:uncharacterized protein LOC111073928 isoform X2 [Drosophila obscura]|uniref:uncharacterized protein LOC111073928 isoform X2 n=1 Tax=Drosophila obscura TaxID=7282 RepID=UPI001BB1D657|nr:uncharacterized protein LOC111073928 isoform X2 [Drosophila obscura]